MHKFVSTLFILLCLNGNAQIKDSFEYDPNLLGKWELHTLIVLETKDTLHLIKDSIYWNTIVDIKTDSITEYYLSTGKRKDLPDFIETCSWSLYAEDSMFWITFRCGAHLGGEHEIMSLSETELITLHEAREQRFLLVFRRIG